MWNIYLIIKYLYIYIQHNANVIQKINNTFSVYQHLHVFIQIFEDKEEKKFF